MSLPRLLICGFGAFPAAPQNPSAAVVEALATAAWRPAAVEAAYLVLPVAWTGSVEAILDLAAATAVDGVLVVGVAVEADGFRIETLGRNSAAGQRPDHHGALWLEPHILADGPASLAVTAPVEAMRAALAAEGLPAQLSDDAGDYLCNFTLYRLLAEPLAPAVGFLHVPQARECDPRATFALDDVDRAVRAAAGAFAVDLRRPAAAPRRA